MSGERKSILLVEDETDLAGALRDKLTQAGYLVWVAKNGNEAIKQLSSKTFSVLLLDLILPYRDGYAVLEYMREENISIPTIVLTNLGNKIDIEDAKNLGIREYLIKTDTSLEKILDAIQRNTN